MATLEAIANLAEILTAIVAAIAAVWYWLEQRKKLKKLEECLKAEKAATPGNQTHTILHLMARVGLTEDEILKASFRSSHITRKLHVNRDTNLADSILFDYKE